MKHSLLILTAILLLSCGVLMAQMNEDGILIVPKTDVAPTIDGVLDTAIWYYVGETLAITPDNADDPNNWYDWFDLFGSFRLLWDDDNLYIWLEVQDDIINDAGGNHEYDGVELYFDGDWSQTEGAYDGFDDVQMRFNVGEFETSQIDVGYGTSTGWGFLTDGIDYIVEQTDLGWVLETSIPLADLQLVADAEFGFDLQINDADESTRETMLRWWADDNNEWIHADLFGTAFLTTSRVVNGDYLPVPKGTAPTIDGEMAPGEWADAWVISGSRLDNAYTLGSLVEGWEDCRNWAYLKWDDTNFYYYLTVWDDAYDEAFEESGEDWNYDSIELFFDGDNSKGTTYDGFDDIQIRFNLGQEGTDAIDTGYGTAASWDWDKSTTNYIVSYTDLGWDAEVAIPLADMQLPTGLEFGFEMQLNDNDEPDVTTDRTVYRWWAPGEPPWSNASMFGTVVLETGAAVETNPATVQSFALQQNYPNPFNPTTTIAYSVAKNDHVQLKVYDMLGREVATLVNDVKPAGEYNVAFDASDLTSGVYVYTMTTGEQTFTNKMLLMK
ncbi:T9SS type A sorting domain-containing protein [candidate division KSB1 bacterium]|nr:T9SS type A sorting domain-containing protein [candidate division KSB1 bacterium]